MAVGLLLLTVVGCGTEEGAVGAGSNPTGDGAVSGPARTGTPVPEGTGVRGQVTDTSRAPVELATVSVAGGPSGSGPVTQEANVTDVQGRYFFPLPPGRWEITVTAHRFRPVTSSVVVTGGEPTTHDLVLEPTGR